MRTCARWWGRGGLPLLMLVPPLLLGLQLLVVGPRLRGATRLEGEDRAGAVAFSVISIEPEKNWRPWGASFRRPGPAEEDGGRREVARAYEDENEMLSQQVNYR